MSAASSRNAIRRLLKELDTWTTTEAAGEQGIERLGPVNDDELLSWEAVINGRGVGNGYESASIFDSYSSLPSRLSSYS